MSESGHVVKGRPPMDAGKVRSRDEVILSQRTGVKEIFRESHSSECSFWSQRIGNVSTSTRHRYHNALVGDFAEEHCKDRPRRRFVVHRYKSNDRKIKAGGGKCTRRGPSICMHICTQIGTNWHKFADFFAHEHLEGKYSKLDKNHWKTKNILTWARN